MADRNPFLSALGQDYREEGDRPAIKAGNNPFLRSLESGTKRRKQEDKEKELTNKINSLLDQGWSYEGIAENTKIDLENVRAYADQSRPGYGVKAPPGPASRSNLSKVWDQLNVADSGRSWQTATPSVENAKKSGWQQGKETGSALFTGVEKVGDALEALPNYSVTTPLFGVSSVAERRMAHWDRQLDEGKITKKQYQELLQKQLKDTEWAGTEDKGTADRLKKSAGVALEATSEIVPFMKAGKAAQLTMKSGAAFGGLTGLAHGTGQELTNPEGFDWKNVGLQTAGGAILGAGGGKLAQWQASKKAARLAAQETELINSQMDEAARKAGLSMDAEDRFVKSQGITDPARLLPDGTESKALRLAEIDNRLAEIRDNTTASTPKQITTKNAGTQPTATTTPRTTATGTPDMRTTAARRQGVVTLDQSTTQSLAPEARELMRERQALVKEIESIKNPELRLAEEVNLVEGNTARAQTSGNRVAAANAEKQQAYLYEQMGRADKDAEIGDMLANTGRGPKTSTLAERTEAMAIEKELTSGYDSLPGYQGINLADEASRVVDHMDIDMDGAVRIAMGVDQPPPGTTAGSYYAGVANRAAKTGDADLLRRLATESARPGQATRMGQEISALQQLDQQNPVTAMAKVLKARKTNNPKIPATITKEEANQVTKLSQDLTKAKDALANGGSRQAYGDADVAFHNYVNELVRHSGPAIKEQLKKPVFYKDALLQATGFTKSLVATLDNSVIGRQGWKTLFTNPKTWARNSLKSFNDMYNVYRGREVIDHVHSDIASRDNALNGLYKKMGLDVYGAKNDFLEEAFPVTFGKANKSRIVTRPFKASEASFSAWQQRTRADLADQYLDIAQKMGVDITNKNELKAIGRMVNSLTSRGGLGSAEKYADGLNKVFFAPRLVKSHLDVLGGHIITGGGGAKFLEGSGSNFVRKTAAKNLLKIAVGSAMALKLAEAATGGKVESDPRSSNFGKVKVGNTRFDLTGGMAGLPTLGARLLTSSTKSSTTGEIKELNTGDFGSQTTFDVLMAFGENKLSPAFRAATDVFKGEDFDGNKPTVGSTIKNLTLPLIIRQYGELKSDPKAANVVAGMIAEGLGISANTYGLSSNWNANNSKQVTGFKEKVSKEDFNKANKEFDQKFSDWYDQTASNEKFWSLSQDDRLSLVTSKKNQMTKDVLRSYGYDYQEKKRTDTTEDLINELKKL